MYRRFWPLSRRHPLCLPRLLSAVGKGPGRFPAHLLTSSSLPPRLSRSLSSQDDGFPDSRVGLVCRELEGLQSLKPTTGTQQDSRERGGGGGGRGWREVGCAGEVEISHRWPEWVDLMEKLLQNGYLDRYGLRRDSPTASKDANRVRTACLNFARDRLDLIRHLSRKDIQIIVGYGCPSSDRKVANSGKRLRAHVGIEEGKVCSLCSLRGNCERAYLNAHKDERGRTVDVMRILLTYGLDLAIGSLENPSCMTKKFEESSRKLLHDMVEFSIEDGGSDSDKMASGSGRISSRTGRQPLPSQIDAQMKQGDWICPKCDFLNFAKNIKCLRCNGVSQEKLRKLKEEYEHLPLKKGDWICDKCNFFNFAKNTKCLQCNEKPTKRQLNPGEWECVSCNYINFQRNAICLKCDWTRPKASNNEGSSAAYRHGTHRNHRTSRISFVRNENCSSEPYHVHLERAEEDDDFWSTSDDGEDDDTRCISRGFKECRMARGRDVVVRHLPEKWRQVVPSENRAGLRNQVKKDVSTMGSSRSRITELDESCSEEEMAGWFGYPKDNKVL